MNTGAARVLLDKCQRSESWPALGYSFIDNDPLRDVRVTHAQIDFICLAAHIRTWTHELDDILNNLRDGHEHDCTSLTRWPMPAWIAYYAGRLAAIDIRSNGWLASVGSTDRDNLPGWPTFMHKCDEAETLVRRLRKENGL